MGRESGKKRKFKQERRQAAEGAAAEKELQGEATAQDQDGQKRKKNKKDPSSELSPEEIERRKIQKELRELALKVKAAGGVYKPQKYKRKVYKEHGGERVGANKAKKDKDRKKQRDTPSWRPYDKVDVVIIPIYWNIKSRLAEKEIVMRAASKVANILTDNSLKTHIDDANAYTPGQKMKYWETAGVLVRVEVGPKEAQNGTAVVALANEPGTVAAKETVNIDLQLMKEIRAKLEQAELRTGGAGKPGKEEHKKQKAKPQELASQAQALAQGVGGEGEAEAENEGPDADVGIGVAAVGSKEGGSDESGEEGGSEDRSEEGGSEQSEEERGDGSGRERGLSEESKGGGSEEEESEGEQPVPATAVPKGSSAAASSAAAAVPASSKVQAGKRRSGAQEKGKPLKQQQQQQQQQQGSSHSVQDVQGGGDELEDDFEIEPEFMPEAEEEEQELNKQERLKRARKNDKAWRKQKRFNGGDAKAWDDDGADKKMGGKAKKEKRVAKVVTF